MTVSELLSGELSIVTYVQYYHMTVSKNQVGEAPS